jgi:predicted nucleic acid-binding Zn ribbon protein
MPRNKPIPEQVVEGSREGKQVIEYKEVNPARTFMYVMIGIFFLVLVISLVLLNYVGWPAIQNLVDSINELGDNIENPP